MLNIKFFSINGKHRKYKPLKPNSLQGGEVYRASRYVQSINAVFTLGKNMLSLVTKETCFTVKSVHFRQRIA